MALEKRPRQEKRHLARDDVADAFLHSLEQRRIHQPLRLQESPVSNSSSRNKMMSNPPSVLQQRQRLHRRQNSTPIAFEAVRMPVLPPSIQRHNSHRRGQSLDQRGPTRGPQGQRGSTPVSITNSGSTAIGQQILREAQQQKPARPGQQHQSPVSPQCGTYTDSTSDPNGFNNITMSAIWQEQTGLQVASPLQQFFPQSLYMPTSASLESMEQDVDENIQHYFQPTHGVRPDFGGDLIAERSMSQPDLQMYAEQRPLTPAQQINSAQLPLTPATTPFKHSSRQNHTSRTAQSSPTRKHAGRNIQSPCPISMQRGRSLEGIFESHDSEITIPSPPGTAPLVSSSFEVAEMPLPRSLSSQAVPMTYSYSNDSHASIEACSEPAVTTTEHAFEPHADGTRTPLFGEIGTGTPILTTNIHILPSSQPGTGCSSPTKPELSPRRMSISDLNLEPGVSASIEETNVTLDDIAQFIEGPDPVDNKWVCKYEDCNKRFGRKENIKSHVQTHLGDRQFKCDHCNKCFVRGHDLKRHAKIHTGSKPYPCLCGNAFARHDALTRHRQRGNCIGAFEGVVKKIVKKGRPRKHRPEMDDRLDKANRTRQRVEGRDYHSHHYASSTTDSSVSNFGSPLTETMETLSIRARSPLDDMSLFGVVTHQQQHQQQQPPIPEVTAFPPDLFTFTPPASPGYSTGNKPSPYHDRALTPTDMADMADIPEITNIQTQQLLTALGHEHGHHSPPSLCHSSSSPLPDLISFDFSSQEPTTSSSSSGQRLSLKDHCSTSSEFDSFLDYAGMGGLDGEGDSFFHL